VSRDKNIKTRRDIRIGKSRNKLSYPLFYNLTSSSAFYTSTTSLFISSFSSYTTANIRSVIVGA